MLRRETAALTSQLVRLLVTLLALVPQPCAAADDPQSSARAAYAEGVEAYNRSDHEAARASFAAAEASFPSPNIELMLGRSLARLGRDLEAQRVLTRAVQGARDWPGKYTTTMEAAQSELQDVEKRLAIVRLRISALHGDESLLLNGRSLPLETWSEPIVLTPGSVRVELTRPGKEPRVQQLELAAGSSVTLELAAPDNLRLAALRPRPFNEPSPLSAAKLAPTPDVSHDDNALHTVSVALVGVGAAGLATFGIFGTMSRTQYSKLRSACPDATVCNDSNRVFATRGQTYQTVANVALSAGAAVLATGVVLWLVTLPGEHTTLALAPGALQLRGSF